MNEELIKYSFLPMCVSIHLLDEFVENYELMTDKPTHTNIWIKTKWTLNIPKVPFKFVNVYAPEITYIIYQLVQLSPTIRPRTIKKELFFFHFIDYRRFVCVFIMRVKDTNNFTTLRSLKKLSCMTPVRGKKKRWRPLHLSQNYLAMKNILSVDFIIYVIPKS